MEHILEKLKELKIELSKDEDASRMSALLLIYNSSMERICTVADNVARGVMKCSDDDSDSITKNVPSLPSLPEKEVWDFALGDTVRIKLPRDEFKWMQRKTLGWRGNINQVFEQVGIVTNIYCKFENSIGVYFPDVYMGVSIYGGVLEKISPRIDSNLSTRWKVGDYVKTISSSKVLKLLQRGLDTIPDKYVGKKGRVVGVTHPCIVVTFNDVTTFDLQSQSLVPCNTDEEIVKKSNESARGFKVGDEVKIISNLKMLIQQQKDYGGWNSSMTKICGEKARVIYVKTDGSMIVQTKNYRGWRLNSESVLGLTEDEAPEQDLKFLPGDVVKVVIPKNIRSVLAMADVPAVFLEYLRSPAVITVVDDDLNYFLRFNSEQHVQTHEQIIRKATTLERENYEAVRSLEENMKIGDQVHIDIGPPNFVRSVIAELNLGPLVTMVLTKPAVLDGYLNAFTAVIRCEDGTRIRLKRKFLTVPQKFHIDNVKATVGLKTIMSIEEVISRAVQDLHTREGDITGPSEVKLSYMHEGSPPSLEFRVLSVVATFESTLSWLHDNSGWCIEEICDGQFIGGGVEDGNPDLEVKIGIIFNDEPSEMKDITDSQTVSETVSETIREAHTPKTKAEPFSTEEMNEEVVRINNLRDFSYLRLCNPALARNVYFPYVIQGVRRTPTQEHPTCDYSPPPYDRVAVTNYSTNANLYPWSRTAMERQNLYNEF